MNTMEKSSKIVDIIHSTDAKLYNTYTVTCEYLTSNKADIVYHNCYLMSQRSKSSTK